MFSPDTTDNRCGVVWAAGLIVNVQACPPFRPPPYAFAVRPRSSALVRQSQVPGLRTLFPVIRHSSLLWRFSISEVIKLIHPLI